jgi:hypothetical protein
MKKYEKRMEENEKRQDIGERRRKVRKRQKKMMGKGCGKTKTRKVRKKKYKGRKKTFNLLLESYRISCEMRFVQVREIAQEIVE